jgi:hypothetical protein
MVMGKQDVSVQNLFLLQQFLCMADDHDFFFIPK